MVALNFFPLAGAISLPLLKDFLRSDVGADNLAPRDLSSTDTNAGLGDGYLTRVETLPNDDGVLTTVISITSSQNRYLGVEVRNAEITSTSSSATSRVPKSRSISTTNQARSKTATSKASDSKTTSSVRSKNSSMLAGARSNQTIKPTSTSSMSRLVSKTGTTQAKISKTASSIRTTSPSSLLSSRKSQLTGARSTPITRSGISKTTALRPQPSETSFNGGLKSSPPSTPSSGIVISLQPSSSAGETTFNSRPTSSSLLISSSGIVTSLQPSSSAGETAFNSRLTSSPSSVSSSGILISSQSSYSAEETTFNSRPQGSPLLTSSSGVLISLQSSNSARLSQSRSLRSEASSIETVATTSGSAYSSFDLDSSSFSSPVTSWQSDSTSTIRSNFSSQSAISSTSSSAESSQSSSLKSLTSQIMTPSIAEISSDYALSSSYSPSLSSSIYSIQPDSDLFVSATNSIDKPAISSTISSEYEITTPFQQTPTKESDGTLVASSIFASLVISTSIAPVTPSPSSAISMSLFSSSFLVERSTLSTAVQVSVSLSNPLPSVSRPSASRPSVPRPSVLLSKPIPLLSSSAQEMQYPLTLSFDAKLYSTISPNISITTNGLLALTTTPFFENAYIDTPAPLPSYMLSPGTIALAWQYMYSTNDTISGIYYQIDNNNNHLSVESILYDSTGHQVHFIVTYSTSAAGVWNVYYFSDNPRSPSGYRIGIQGENAISTDLLPPASGILDDAWLESSDSIAKGRLLRFNTTTENGTLTSTTFAARCFGPGTFPMGTCGSPAM